jgi:hypothetical protein
VEVQQPDNHREELKVDDVFHAQNFHYHELQEKIEYAH